MTDIAAPPPPNWATLQSGWDEFRLRWSNDDFTTKVLSGGLKVAMDGDNPIGGNLFAAAVRELSGHILHTRAPDEAVRRCAWFEQARDTRTVTRAQRAGFIAHAGLLPSYVEGTLGLAREEYIDPLIEAMDLLNKATHVRPNTIIAGGAQTHALAGDILTALSGLMEAAEECRDAVIKELHKTINTPVLNKLMSETVGALDELSTHTIVEEASVDDIQIVDLGVDRLDLALEGTVYVTLQYGSGSDFRRGDGASMSDNYPFTANLEVGIGETLTLGEPTEVEVDNSSFYGLEPDDDENEEETV
ncbi:hypothetical protein [Caulobacter sp. CCG-8]|uniref:pPIWI-associating nuclease domain-containing protein n=1 Tax=Caulobacter sp. CCG-8 TaxID=3127958 RepID=UPI00307CFFF4